MPVFLSHHHDDKPIVETYGQALRQQVDPNQVLLDSWILSPGDSIVDFMNQGIDSATHFVLFWSRNANKSRAVKCEWQAALMKSFRGEIRFIVVRLDDEPVPAILGHLKYIRHNEGYASCSRDLRAFVNGGLDPTFEIVANEVYYEVTFCRDDSLLIKLVSIGEVSEIGPFMLTSDTSHSFLQWRSEEGRNFETLVSDEASLDGRSRYGLGFRFLADGLTRTRPAYMRLLKLRRCAPELSRLHVKRNERWEALPLNDVVDETAA